MPQKSGFNIAILSTHISGPQYFFLPSLCPHPAARNCNVTLWIRGDDIRFMLCQCSGEASMSFAWVWVLSHCELHIIMGGVSWLILIRSFGAPPVYLKFKQEQCSCTTVWHTQKPQSSANLGSIFVQLRRPPERRAHS